MAIESRAMSELVAPSIRTIGVKVEGRPISCMLAYVLVGRVGGSKSFLGVRDSIHPWVKVFWVGGKAS